jgi:uncharacterized protein (TIGR03067 family)
MNDQERIQGTWTVVSAESRGKPLPDDMMQHVRLIFDGDTHTTKHKNGEMRATFRLNPETTPREIDMDMDGHVGKGIYELEGDTLKIVHGEVGDARPGEFPPAGSGLTVLVLSREKP